MSSGRPTGIDVDHHGHVFVADTYNHRIQEFTDGRRRSSAKWGVSAPSTDPLYLPDVTGLDVDAHGDVYVTDFTDATSWVGQVPPTGGGMERG